MPNFFFFDQLRLICVILLSILILSGCGEKSPPFKKSEIEATGTVYFVCRSEYEAPLGHRIVKFKADSVLDWFQRQWPDSKLRHEILNPEQKGSWVLVEGEGEDVPIYNRDAIWNHIESVFNGPVYDMFSVWEAMANWGVTPPETVEELAKFAETINYYPDGVLYSEHGIQVVTDDDEIDISWYLFDDKYVQTHPERAAFLIREDWKLPENSSNENSSNEKGDDVVNEAGVLLPKGKGNEGFTYCVFLSALDGMTILDITGAFRFDGVRLPDLGRFLRTSPVPLVHSEWRDGNQIPQWPEELLLTRGLLISTKSDSLSELFVTAENSSSVRELWTRSRMVSDLNYKKIEFLTGNEEKCLSDMAVLLEKIEEQEAEKSYWKYGLQPLLIQDTPNMAQVRFRHQVRTRDNNENLAHEDLKSFIFFDDLWIAENPILAESILRYAKGWDVLFPDPEG